MHGMLIPGLPKLLALCDFHSTLRRRFMPKLRQHSVRGREGGREVEGGREGGREGGKWREEGREGGREGSGTHDLLQYVGLNLVRGCEL